MRMMLVILLLLAGSGVSQCDKCNGEGWYACTSREHDSSRLCGMKERHRCTVIWRAKCCLGTHKVICEACNDREAARDVHKEYKRRRAWTRQMSQVDLNVGGRFVHVETEHFLVHSSIPAWRFSSGKLEREKAAHEFARRLEGAADDFKKVVGATPARTQEMFIMSNLEEMLRATQKLSTAGAQKRPLKTIGASRNKYFTFPNWEGTYTDKGLHAHLYHGAVHLLVHGTHRGRHDLPAWIDIGLTHWLESKRFRGAKNTDNFCIEHPGTSDPWLKSKNWKKRIKKEIASGKALGFDDVAATLEQSMDARTHVYCWSWVDAVIAMKGDAFPRLFKAMKGSRVDTAKALKTALGMSPDEFMQAWRKRARR